MSTNVSVTHTCGHVTQYREVGGTASYFDGIRQNFKLSKEQDVCPACEAWEKASRIEAKTGRAFRLPCVHTEHADGFLEESERGIVFKVGSPKTTRGACEVPSTPEYNEMQRSKHATYYATYYYDCDLFGPGLGYIHRLKSHPYSPEEEQWAEDLFVQGLVAPGSVANRWTPGASFASFAILEKAQKLKGEKIPLA